MTEQEMRQAMQQWQKKHEDRSRQFWEEAYPTMTFENKVIYWRKEVFNNMEWQGENNGDPYKAFTKEWLDNHRALEPAFDQILKEVVERLGLESELLLERLKK
jgi:hypothetical protein